MGIFNSCFIFVVRAPPGPQHYHPHMETSDSTLMTNDQVLTVLEIMNIWKVFLGLNRHLKGQPKAPPLRNGKV